MWLNDRFLVTFLTVGAKCACMVLTTQLTYNCYTAYMCLPHRAVGTFLLGYHTYPLCLLCSSQVAHMQGGVGIPMWPFCSSHVATIQLPCSSHTADLLLPHKIVGVFLCGYCIAPMCLLYSHLCGSCTAHVRLP